MSKLFVYGTLREGQVSHFFLNGSLQLEKDFRVKGYAMYNLDFFPAARLTPGNEITGELYEVNDSRFIEMDAYEGVETDLFIRHYDAEYNFFIYLFATDLEGKARKITSGNWLIR